MCRNAESVFLDDATQHIDFGIQGGRDIVLPSYKAAISALFRIRTNSCGRTLLEERLENVSEAFP